MQPNPSLQGTLRIKPRSAGDFYVEAVRKRFSAKKAYAETLDFKVREEYWNRWCGAFCTASSAAFSSPPATSRSIQKMASDLEFVEYVCDQIRGAGSISFRKMFGEYAIYCNGKVIALVCDN